MAKKIGLIVDGEGDLRSLRERFNQVAHVRVSNGPRGHQAPIYSIASHTMKAVKILAAQKRCSYFILVLDFEERNINYKVFVETLEKQIEKCCGEYKVDIACANIMLENWILADIFHLSKRKKYLTTQKSQKIFEGKHGKKELKKIFKAGERYRETEHGPELFGEIRFSKAKLKSRSLNEFLTKINNP